MMEGNPMLFSSNRGRMQSTAHAGRKARRRQGSWPASAWKPTVEPLEARTLLSLFGPPSNYAVGHYPTSIAAGDLNGDNVIDLVEVNEFGNSASVLLGHGDGTFAASTQYAVGRTPVGIALGELNGDGALDVVSLNADGNSVSVLLGHGNGTFAGKTDYALGLRPGTFALGDVNGDGQPDVVAGNVLGNTVAVLLGNADGSFGASTIFVAGTGVTGAVGLGDLNGDGHLDLVVGHPGQMSVLLGNGDGTFKPPTSLSTGDTASFLALGDVNEDGRLDLVTANDPGNNVSVLLGNGNGTLSAPTRYSIGGRTFFPALGDLNGDGHLDIITANPNADDRQNGSMSVFLGNGDGTFGAKTDFALGRIPPSIALGDFNGDNRLDAAVAVAGDNTVSVLLNTSSTTLPSLSIADTSVKENPLGTRYATFTVTLSAASDQTVTVHYGTAPGAATPGIDYIGQHGIRTFLPGQTTRKIGIHILNDQPTGVNEQFFLNLSNATNATIADSQAVCTIVESGSAAPAPGNSPSAPAPSRSNSDRSAQVNDQGAIVAGFVASRSSHNSQVATMAYGTATPVVDSVGRHGTLTYLTGQSTLPQKGTHGNLTNRHAVVILFATDDGETGL
jgi:hypothetical protein